MLGFLDSSHVELMFSLCYVSADVRAFDMTLANLIYCILQLITLRKYSKRQAGKKSGITLLKRRGKTLTPGRSKQR